MKNYWKALIVIAILILITNCSIITDRFETQQDTRIQNESEKDNSVKSADKCGDGICDKLEHEKGICPIDCQTETKHQNSKEEPSTNITNNPEAFSGKLKFGFMVHLEGWFDEVENEDIFEKHMSAALDLASVFESHGAKVTFEASPETIAASKNWKNYLLDLQNRGHGIGVHADRGYSNKPGYNLLLFTNELREMKEGAESLGLTIQHVSGTCSDLDWAKASIDAGFQFTTGGVGYCAMSMPEELRPEEYKNCPSPAQCHGNMPIDMEERIHPWKINTALGDWTQDDPDGKLVILASDGGIKNLFEETLDSSATHGDMEYDNNDIEILLEKVDEALLLSDPDKINILYLSLSVGAPDIDPVFYNKLFEALQPYVNSGQLEFKTMNEMFEEFEQIN